MQGRPFGFSLCKFSEWRLERGVHKGGGVGGDGKAWAGRELRGRASSAEEVEGGEGSEAGGREVGEGEGGGFPGPLRRGRKPTGPAGWKSFLPNRSNQ